MSARRNDIRRWAAPLGALALLLCSLPAAAQQADVEAARCEDDAPWETNRSDSDSYPRNHCVPRSSRFTLFGFQDFAGSGLRGAAPDVSYWVTNSGLSDSGRELQGETLPFATRGTESNPSGKTYQNFELQFIAAASRGDWLRNREIVTSLNNVTGGGWTFTANTQRLGGFHQWSGHDGSIGILHSGTQSGGGGCLDHYDGGYGWYPNGFPLLAGSDCEETWGSAGWQGRGWIGPIENWIEYFDDFGPCTGLEEEDCFTFDFWDVPERYHSERQTVGDFQVFGTMSDHGDDNVARFGAVIPGGSGDPQLEGYPMGLDVHFNAYSFQIPSVSRGFIYEGLIVNHSEDVYGVPLDYDSVYFGQMVRPLRSSGGGRRANPHAVPELGAVVHNELGRTPDCDGAIQVPQSIDCSSPRNRTPGFAGGAQGHLILKSPIGDLRNKHFSDPASPFYAPDHPNAGDTITFNRMSMCSYRCTVQHFIYDARKAYGIIAAKPRDVLDGRDPVTDLTPFVRWEIFHQYYAPDGSERFCDPNNPTQPGCFGYKVPGDWSYTNRPSGTAGGPDTLWIDNCRPPTDVTHPGANECTGLWADTLPDRTLNWTQNVIWPIAGPFPLAAGDTVPWVTATFAAPDSASFMQGLEAFYNFYMNDFYLGPGLPTPPNITSVTTTGGSARLGEASITLFLDDAAEDWIDPFALKAVSDLRNPKPGTIFEQIAAADPTAADRLEAQLQGTNVDTVYIYKSCDRGRTFTADPFAWDCEPSPTVNTTGEAIGTGWEAWAALTPSDGSFPNTFRDTDIATGQRYLYTLVAHTPGIHLETQYLVDTDGDLIPDTPQDTTLTFVPEGSSVFTTNLVESFVADVYAPASTQAGSDIPFAELADRTGQVPYDAAQIAIVPEEQARSEGLFSLYFGSNAIVTESRPAPDSVGETVVQLERSVRALMPDGSLADVVVDTVVYTSTEPAGLLLGTTGDAETTVTQVGDVLVTETVFNALSGLLMDESTGEPVFVSARLSTGQFTPGQLLTHPLSPEFVIEVDDDPGEFVAGHWTIYNPEEQVWDDLRSRSDPSIGWLNSDATSTGVQYGTYIIDWGAEVFPGDLPLVDVFNPSTTIDAYQNLLANRPTVSLTEVGADVLAAIQRDIDPAITEDDLTQVTLPFTINNISYGEEENVGTPVHIAMLADSKIDEVLLGNAPDSVTSPVPEDRWIPGETLIFLEDVPVALTNPDGSLQLANGEPVMGSQLRVTWSEALLACEDPRNTCNPVSGPRRAGIPGYVKVRPNDIPRWPDGWDLRVYYKNPFTSQTSFAWNLYPAATGEEIETLTGEDLAEVRVVPNPYIGRSSYEVEGDVRRLLFTHLPPRGRIQIFTASGQFIQRLSWEPGDLMGNGDLFWNMQTREGNLIASGLYLFVVEASEDPNCHSSGADDIPALGCGGEMKHIGRFIVIR